MTLEGRLKRARDASRTTNPAWRRVEAQTRCISSTNTRLLRVKVTLTLHSRLGYKGVEEAVSLAGCAVASLGGEACCGLLSVCPAVLGYNGVSRRLSSSRLLLFPCILCLYCGWLLILTHTYIIYTRWSDEKRMFVLVTMYSKGEVMLGCWYHCNDAWEEGVSRRW